MKKTLSFAALHLIVAFSVGYIMTGSLLVGGAIALVEPAVNTIAYYFHEKIWIHLKEQKHSASKPISIPTLSTKHS